MQRSWAALVLATSLASTGTAQTSSAPAPSPGEIVAAAPASEWTAIAPSDLLVMDLAPDAKGKARRVVIQLMPAPFSQGWVGNIRKLAAAQWWDGTSINRVQDNYVVQWGDATENKALPEGLGKVAEEEYRIPWANVPAGFFKGACAILNTHWSNDGQSVRITAPKTSAPLGLNSIRYGCSGTDPYSALSANAKGFPFAYGSRESPNPNAIFEEKLTNDAWPVHCYGMVGVGRNLSPDTGSGAELYTVIGHAPRHLDRNIALVGRVIDGIEHLSSLPRGTGALGFYEKEEERVPIAAVRIGAEIADLPAFEYLATESATFAKYADARANRRDPFFNVPAGGADICNIPVPVRRRVK
jgi:peptidylprolyl isomerase